MPIRVAATPSYVHVVSVVVCPEPPTLSASDMTEIRMRLQSASCVIDDRLPDVALLAVPWKMPEGCMSTAAGSGGVEDAVADKLRAGPVIKRVDVLGAARKAIVTSSLTVVAEQVAVAVFVDPAVALVPVAM